VGTHRESRSERSRLLRNVRLVEWNCGHALQVFDDGRACALASNTSRCSSKIPTASSPSREVTISKTITASQLQWRRYSGALALRTASGSTLFFERSAK
jgi:hypothetical protein